MSRILIITIRIQFVQDNDVAAWKTIFQTILGHGYWSILKCVDHHSLCFGSKSDPPLNKSEW